jgi:hypothetical protein
MPRTPDWAPPPSRLPAPWVPVFAPARGSAAVAMYLRAHLYGAAMGRSVLDRCISAVDPGDRERLVPFRAEFEEEIATAAGLLRTLSPLGTPGRRVLRASSAVALTALPVGPVLRDPLARLAVLEALRTLVVAKRSMWELLSASWVGDGTGDDDEGGAADTSRLLRDLAEQARAQEELLESLRRDYGLAAFG